MVRPILICAIEIRINTKKTKQKIRSVGMKVLKGQQLSLWEMDRRIKSWGKDVEYRNKGRREGYHGHVERMDTKKKETIGMTEQEMRAKLVLLIHRIEGQFKAREEGIIPSWR